MNFFQLQEEELNNFVNIHQQILPNRKDRYKTLKISEKDNVNIDLQTIINKSKEILEKSNYLNFNDSKYVIEFHQRNAGFEKNKYGYFDWHTDDYELRGFPVYTILYYIRKDKTIKGGDLEYKINSKKNIHIVNEKDILCFPGNISHYPQPTSGFGCRDLIAVFIKKIKKIKK